MKIEIFDNTHKLSSLKKVWNELLGCSCLNNRVFFTYEWFACFIRSFGLQERLAIIILRSRDKIIGILPLYKAHFKNMGITFTVLKSISNVHTPKYSFIIKAGYENMLNEAIIRSKAYLQWDFIQLDYVTANSYILKALCGNGSNRLSVTTVPILKSPHIVINSDWSEYYRGLSKNLRTSIDRKERKAQKDYGIQFECINGKLLSSDTLYEAFSIEDTGWKGKNKSSILTNHQVIQFYHDLAFAMNRNGWFDLLFLKFSEKRVAFDYCLKFNGTYEMLKVGYDEAYKKYSPGMILRKLAIMNAFKNRYGKYDFLGSPDQYKVRMANRLEELNRLYVFDTTPKSKIVKFMLHDAKEILEQLGLKDHMKRLYFKLKRQHNK